MNTSVAALPHLCSQIRSSDGWGVTSVVEYSVDLKLLQETTDRIERLVRDVTTAIETVHSDVATPCQEALQGATGSAFQDKHAQWSETITRANGEMAEMRAAAQRAHDNYSAAKAANRAMLGR